MEAENQMVMSCIEWYSKVYTKPEVTCIQHILQNIIKFEWISAACGRTSTDNIRKKIMLEMLRNQSAYLIISV